VNKINGPWFSKFDEDLATAFSIYCGISIAHVRGRERSRANGGPPFCSPHRLSLLCPDSGLEFKSPEAGVLCRLQCMLATLGSVFV
jgi:hypothetical protein